MAEPSRGVVNLDIRELVPELGAVRAAESPCGYARMWLYVVLDDVGFGALGCCGGIVDTPNIDRIAESWFAKTVGTPRRCAPRPGPACDRAN